MYLLFESYLFICSNRIQHLPKFLFIALPLSKGSYLMQGFIFVPIIKWDFFVFSKLTKKNTFCIKFCQWLDSNCRSLVLEQTALPIELQLLHYICQSFGLLICVNARYLCLSNYLSFVEDFKIWAKLRFRNFVVHQFAPSISSWLSFQSSCSI